MTKAIEVRSLTRTYGRVRALDGVNLVVPEHSILGLLGRNGAGKTTIMSIIAGQDRQTSGQVEVLGNSPFEHAPTLAQISFVRDNQRYPDDYRLHHVLRIAPDFAPNWSSEVAGELADSLRIPAKIPIKKLSRGQLSSIAIILGLASRAPITLLDEPYLGLDVTGRALFHRMLLRDYEHHPRTVVLSTHLIEESSSLFDQVAIMNRGRVVAGGERDEVVGSAWVMSGVTDAVSAVLADRPVVHHTTVGALMSATGSFPLEDATRQRAQELNVQIAPASLQDLVSAYGVNEPEATDGKVAERA